jgi:hypothetical protein
MVGSVKLQSTNQSTRQQGHTASTPTSSQTGTNTQYPPSHVQTSKVNVVQSTSSEQFEGNKKNKGKSKKSSNQWKSKKTQGHDARGKKKKGKLSYHGM